MANTTVWPLILLAATTLAFSTSTPLPLNLLFQNSLNWTENSISHPGLLLSSTPSPLLAAEEACSSLSEELATISSSHASFQQLLDYQIYDGALKDDQLLWIHQSSDKRSHSEKCTAVKANNLAETVQEDCSAKLPALCSNSAPYSNSTLADSSSRWHVSVSSEGRSYIGYRDYASFRFLGIPYANPPARWEYSTIYSNKQKTINATVGGAPCTQTGVPDSSEDCLFLNIWSPHLPESPSKSKLKPVMFWIHGGAFTNGMGTDSTFDGGSLASRGDVVHVTINYRLSTLGFLALDDGVINGNYGLADQITALQWVKRNIAAFGGDPSHITIFGQSAGAGSVRALVASAKAEGLFHGAIVESNLAGSGYASTYSNYLTIPQEVSLAADDIVSLTNCNGSSNAAVRACLMKVPAATLVSLSNVARYVVVDGTYITSNELPLDGKSYGVSKIPIIWGWMADDAGPFLSYPTANETLSTFALSQSLLMINTSFLSMIESSGLFPIPDTGNSTLGVFNTTVRLTTDLEFKCLDQATVNAGVTNEVFDKTWMYEFQRSYQPPTFNPNTPVCDAPKTPTHPLGDVSLPYFHCHSGELYYVFGTLGQFGLPFRDLSDLTFSRYILDTWTAFGRTFNPNPEQEWLEARGYVDTLATVKSEESWEPVRKGSKKPLRAFTGGNSISEGWKEVEQCDLVGYPLDYYL